MWDWSSNISNYTTLRVQNEAKLKNAGWEIESSIALNDQVIKNVILSGGQYYGNGGLSSGAPVDATQDYLPIGAADAGASAGDAGSETAEQVRDDDVNTLFTGLNGSTVRVTRIRSDIAQKAMTTDFLLQASTDQSELSNVRTVTQAVNLTCPIYNGCNVVGTGTPAQAAASVDGGASSGGSASGGGAQNGAGAPGSKPNTSTGGSCTTSAPGNTAPGVAFGALAGALGLFVGRTIRVRRRRSRSKG